MSGRGPEITVIETPVTGLPSDVDLARLFPAIIPDCEQIIWNALDDATRSSMPFPEDAEGVGLFLPASFSTPPALALFAGMDESYPPVAGNPVVPIPIIKGWVPASAKLPSIGVALATENEDGAQRLGQGGFAGDLDATDSEGKVVATCAYYAEPLYSTVVVELVHENRDERDRLHNHLRTRLYPLRHLVPERIGTVKELQVQAEKQELPLDEQPYTVYVSLFTVEMWSEALIPTTILSGGAGIIGEVTVNIEGLAES